MLGRTIHQYEILEKLGAGGMGEIYKAQDRRLNRTVAIKVLTGDNSDADARRRFIQEAQAASGLNHPNLITIHDIISDGNDQFMVMEYVNGRTLADMIGEGRLDAPTTLRYGVQIADGLAAAHAAGIVHRDLKPGNIMVTAQGFVKILDFGLAKLTHAQDCISLTDVTQTVGPVPLTVRGSILGTVAYMSPEQAQGSRVDARSDIFSFGSVLYEMITGKKAFSGETPLLTLTTILRDEPQPIGSIVAGTPPELVQLIHRAMRKDPHERVQSMEEVHSDLVTLKQKQDSGIFTAPQAVVLGDVTSLPANSRKILAAVVASAVLVCLLAGFWWWRRGGGPIPAATSTPARPAVLPSGKPSPLSPPVLGNQAIFDMAQAHVPESVIIGQIHASQTNFNLSTSEIIRLTKGGVTANVIHAMRNPSAIPPGGTPGDPGAASGVVPPAQEGSGHDKTVQVIGGVPFDIVLLDDVSPDCQPGQALRFRANKDVVMGDTVVISKGALVTGVITEAARKKFLVHSTRPTYRLLEAAGVNGSKIRVRATPARTSGKDPSLEPLGGSKTKDAIAVAGSRFMAYVDGDQTVTVRVTQ